MPTSLPRTGKLALSGKPVFSREVRLLLGVLIVLCGSCAGPRFPDVSGDGRADPSPVEPVASEFVVFDGKGETASLVLPEGGGDALRQAVEELRRRIPQMGGGEVEILAERDRESGGSVIVLEEAEFEPSVLFPPGTDERFQIVVEKDVLRIRAEEPLGWEFGLYTLLDHYGGVRWFWPGEEGTYVPEPTQWTIPCGTTMFEPAYVARRFTGFRGEGSREWLRRNRVHNKLSFSHNLRRIFDREFFLAHPETLAVDWDPSDPPPEGHPIWRFQPDLSSDLVVEAAAEAAIRAFREDPSLVSFSLSTNDNTRYGDSPGIRSDTRPMRYFRDLPDYSDSVFRFMNRVAAIVEETFPNRFLGCLSYMWTENVPSFPVHPMVMPYLTADRSQGYDVNFTEEDRRLVKKWTEAGPRLIGVWDYLHSARHPFPRRANLIVGQRIRDMARAGVRAYTAEMNPVWPFHGELPWMVARMLWNPSLKPGELEREFQDRFFGPAAREMGAFYKLAWRSWMFQGGEAEWVKYFENEDGIELFGGERLREMTAALDRASEAVGEGIYGRRVDAVREAWTLTLARDREQQLRRALVVAENPSEDQLSAFWEARDRADERIEELTHHAWTASARRGRIIQSDPSYQAIMRILGRKPEASSAILDRFREQAKRLADPGAEFTVFLAQRSWETTGERLSREGSLTERMGGVVQTGPEPWEKDLARPWRLRVRPSGSVSIEWEGCDAEESLVVRDAYAVGVVREFSVEEGRFYEGTVRLATRVTLGNRTSVQFRWWGDYDQPVGNNLAIRIPASEEPIRSSYTVYGYPPPGAVRGELMVAAVRQAAGDFLAVEEAELRSFPTTEET